MCYFQKGGFLDCRANGITSPEAVYNRDMFYGEAMRQIARRTGGRLEIQTHWNNELGFGQRDWPKLLKEGLVEISDLPMVMGAQYISDLGYEHVTQHLGAPYDRSLNVEIMKARRPIYTELIAQWNGKRLASYTNASQYEPVVQEFVSTKPLRRLDDMKGVTIRSPSPIWAEVWANFGIKPVVISMPEMYLALKTGMVDAAAPAGLPTSLTNFTRWLST